MSQGTLYIVSTPIGNLEDITLRALRILRESDLIAAEDTRHSLKLLNHYAIKKRLISCWSEREKAATREIIDSLQRGCMVALITDAGTPGISDPGSFAIRSAIEAGFTVIPIPGCSALTAALPASGIACDEFLFLGFLPTKKTERIKKLKTLQDEQRTMLFYEAPHRIIETLEDMEEPFGERRAALAREITKIHEEFLRGSLSEIIHSLRTRKIAGEYVIVLEGAASREPDINKALEDLLVLIKQGHSRKEAAKVTAQRYGLKSKTLYDMSMEGGELNQTKLRYEIENIYSLPTLPPVLRKLLILIEDPSISMKELGNFILKDPSIAAKVIMVANSPVYGFMSRITTINQALMLLGLNSIKGILLGISVFEYMEKAMAGLWQHSIGCAVAAKIIAEKTSNPKISEDVAISSLIHDIGKVVFSLKFPSEYEFVLNKAALEHSYIYEKEKALFEISHADVGAWLAYKWNFPQVLVETIKYHHQPSLAKTAIVHTAVVNLANILIKSMGFGFSGDIFPPLLHPQVVSLLDLNEWLLKDIVDEIDNELSDADDLMPF